MLTRLSPDTKLLNTAYFRLHRRFEHIINVSGYPNSGDDVALFIDWENFKISLAAGNRAPNVSALKEEVSNHGRVVVAKAYADWVTRSPELKGASQFIIDPPALYAAGIEPVYVPTRLPLGTPSPLNTRTTRVKNSVDVKMTADCIECAHSYPNIGTYVLVSGDSDFIHVINSLRAIGKRVIIIGVSWSTSRRLADQVDGLILYDIDVDPEHQPEPSPAPTASERSSRSNGGNRQQLSDVMRQIEEIVRSERNAGRTPLLTSLKQRIMRRVPGFDEKKLGFSGFKKLILRTAEEGTIKLVTVGLVDWVIMAGEPDPVEVVSESRSERGSVETVAADEEVVLEERSSPESAAVAPSAEEPARGMDEAGTGWPESSDQPSQEGGGNAASVEADSFSQSDSLTEGVSSQLGTTSDYLESDGTEEISPPALSPELAQALDETLARLELPRGPGDGQDGRRISDLIIMADMLEHRDGITHVAFNFLLSEVCDALQQGLEAEHPEIAGRWGGRTYSRTYVTRLLRELGDKEIFLRDWHQERNEETGRTSRFRTFNLNRTHRLVREALISHWGPDTDTVLHEPQPSGEEAPEALPELEMVEDKELSSSGAKGDEVTEAEENPPEEPGRSLRRRSRQSPAAELGSESLDEAAPQPPVGEVEGREPAAEEGSSAAPARTSRRRGRQAQAAKETLPMADQAPSESDAAEAQFAEAIPPAPPRSSRRRSSRSQTTGETSQSPEPVASAVEGAEGEANPATTARPARRRGRQRQPAGDSLQSPEGEPGQGVVGLTEHPAPGTETVSAAVD